MNPYEKFVGSITRILDEAKSAQLGGFPVPAHPTVSAEAPKALIFSPHPDDEVVIGALALRLQRELKWKGINVAVTQGSNPARQAGRWKELSDCCRYIGFDLIQTRVNGLVGINLKTREGNPAAWQPSVDRIAEILKEQQPRVILFPHDRDWNSTHIGTHYLLKDALAKCGNEFTCYTVETEFWGAMDDPNLMIESSEQDLADMITALTFHVEEVRRNPYHLILPAWMIDNVRRGSELVGGQGGASPKFTYATLYRLQKWRHGKLEPVFEGGKFVGADDDLSPLFK